MESAMRRWVLFAVICTLLPSTAAQAASNGPGSGPQEPASRAVVKGRVLDSSGAAIVAAQVTVTPDRPGSPASAVTSQQGEFEIAVTPGAYTVRVSALGFVEASRHVTVGQGAAL